MDRNESEAEIAYVIKLCSLAEKKQCPKRLHESLALSPGADTGMDINLAHFKTMYSFIYLICMCQRLLFVCTGTHESHS